MIARMSASMVGKSVNDRFGIMSLVLKWDIFLIPGLRFLLFWRTLCDEIHWLLCLFIIEHYNKQTKNRRKMCAEAETTRAVVGTAQPLGNVQLLNPSFCRGVKIQFLQSSLRFFITQPKLSQCHPKWVSICYRSEKAQVFGSIIDKR